MIQYKKLTNGEGRRVTMEVGMVGLLMFAGGLYFLALFGAIDQGCFMGSLQFAVRILRSAFQSVCGALCVLGAIVVFTAGCGQSLPEPTDPVTVDVRGPSAEFEPTMNFYLWLSLSRIGFAECEAARASLEEGRAIRAAARQEVQLLRDEFVAYVHSGQTGEYCGPVCEEMKEFLENTDVSICEE
jgi:hypothetical protein